MRLVRFNLHRERRNLARLGAILDGERVVDLRAAYNRLLAERGEPLAQELAALRIPGNIISLLAGGEPALDALQAIADWADGQGGEAEGLRGEPLFAPYHDCRLHAPVRPTKLVMVRFPEPSGPPEIVPKPIGTVVGPTRNIIPPTPDTKLTCGAGIGIVMGRTSVGLHPGEVWDDIAGYCLMTDVALPDCGEDGGSYTRSMHQSFAPSGPWLQLRADRAALDAETVRLSVNGQTRQQVALPELPWTIERTIAYLSPMGFDPGDMIWIGKAAAPDAVVGLGDVVAIESEGLGVLRNRLALSQPPN